MSAHEVGRLAGRRLRVAGHRSQVTGWVRGAGNYKTRRKLHWRMRVRGRLSGCEILGGGSS